MRIGLFGGTFDPIHQAHLRVAQAAADQCHLDRVLLVPAAHPPHRTSGAFASYVDRFRMLEIACMGLPRLSVSALDDRPEKSYSIHTVQRLRATLGDADDIYFLIGADAFAEFQSWHRWQDLARLVTFAVVTRPGASYIPIEGVCAREVTGLSLTTSSSGIRAQLARGETDVDLPPGVLDYIREHRLYGFP